MISDIRLQHFRSYQDAAFEFSESVNIIVGPNASGKTNLVEALLLLARGASYRAADLDLIAFDEPWARIDAHTDQHDRVLKLLREGKDKKLFEIDGKVFRRLSRGNMLPLVLFEPNHLTLLSGSPEHRRVYLDDLLEQTQSSYGQVRRAYKRTLAQRNSLLKLGLSKASAQIFPWNIRLSELAGQIVRARTELTHTIADQLPDLYTELSHSPKQVTIEYLPMFDAAGYETQMLKKLESSMELDVLRGFTATGPHREDFELTYDGWHAADIASRGETRTAVLALKILELSILEGASDVKPLLLLDDVFSELDGSRRKLLTSYVEKYQSFITTTDADIVIQNFTETCNIIPLQNQ
jgi:DNA replication and repair protein RecF